MKEKKIKATPAAGAYYTSYKNGVKNFHKVLSKGCGCGGKLKKG